MPDEPKEIIVDDDWKPKPAARKNVWRRRNRPDPRAAARRPRRFRRHPEPACHAGHGGLGMLAAPGGQPLPPNLEMAKHFIDLLQVLEDKTKGNLTPEEKGLLDQVLYEMRMTFVQIAGGATGMTSPPAPPQS